MNIVTKLKSLCFVKSLLIMCLSTLALQGYAVYSDWTVNSTSYNNGAEYQYLTNPNMPQINHLTLEYNLQGNVYVLNPYRAHMVFGQDAQNGTGARYARAYFYGFRGQNANRFGIALPGQQTTFYATEYAFNQAVAQLVAQRANVFGVPIEIDYIIPYDGTIAIGDNNITRAFYTGWRNRYGTNWLPVDPYGFGPQNSWQ